MKSFWARLPKPFLALAPMEDVTDTVFRRIVASSARPDVFFTEFVNVEGMYSSGQESVRQRLTFTQKEHPIVAQIWGTEPDYFYKAAQELVQMGFDGIDLNFGCPEKKVIKKGACIALINDRSLATEIIQATQTGAEGKIPVSLKTRIGLREVITEEWIGFLLGHQLDALTIHGRTAKEASRGKAHWDEIGKAVKMRDTLKLDTLIIGNGDVLNREDALFRVLQSGVDGVMIGRGIFHDIQSFAFETPKALSVSERIHLLLEHCNLFYETWGDTKPFHTLKKYFKIYVQDFTRASELRIQLMQTKSVKEAERIIKNYLETIH